MKVKEPPPCPIYKAPGDVLKALDLQATRLSGLRARLKLRFMIQGHAQPGIKGQVIWAKGPKGELVRITGIGLFGTTVFDCLVTKEAFYLFIPSHNVVYVTRNGRGIGAFIKDASRWLLNPWAIVKMQDVKLIPCNKKKGDSDALICIKFSHRGKAERVEFAKKTLMPVSVRDPELNVSYMYPEVLEDGSFYPTKLCLKIKELDLEMNITLKDIQIDSVTPTDTAFDPGPFLAVPMRPLRGLLESVRPYLTKKDHYHFKN
ncbi:MAG: hypothetical protein GWP10_03640 [Nitrospiraceae bacterium]|nr:hypothetical protein [Nitrospiraceae bacterium]